MREIVFNFYICLLMLGYSTQMKWTKLEKPILLQAKNNFQPPGVMGRPEYTIYEESKWDYKCKTENSDYVCCTMNLFHQ